MKNIELDNVDRKDYPDFVDAFIAYAEHDNGTPYTDEELEQIQDEDWYQSVVQEKAMLQSIR